jgi:LMBR1 domain-containing protein 1
MSFISWILFILFGGIGLPAIPLDFIYYFVSRPKTLNVKEMEEKRKMMNQDIEKLRELATQLKELEAEKVNTYNSTILI